jgi:hypothetical protein
MMMKYENYFVSLENYKIFNQLHNKTTSSHDLNDLTISLTW